MLRIDDNVPIPAATVKAGNIAATLRALKPGQSVLIPDYNTQRSSAAMHAARKASPGRTFMSRAEGSGVRIWRTDGKPVGDVALIKPADLFS